MKRCIILAFLFGEFLSVAQAQTNSSAFNSHTLWNPLFYPHYGNQFRSANGAPGPAYWQNGADYVIAATLDTLHNRITGKVTITYTNNSPDNLSFLWLQMDQNLFKKDSRGTAAAPMPFSAGKFTKGYELNNVSLQRGHKSIAADYLVSDTRMQIRLKEPLKAQGGVIKITIDYAFEIPPFVRTGLWDTRYGKIYAIAQWYPRMEVYDDVLGWNTLPYLLMGEFYLEYGTIDYSITVPANLVVVGTGRLVNPEETLTATERKRLATANQSDTTIFIHTARDVMNPNFRPQKGTRTWHFICKKTRDVAWAASKAFVWDAARINLPKGKKALAQSVYTVEMTGDTGWGRSTQFIKACMEFYSRRLNYPYTYPTATNVPADGFAGGMEYPGMVFNQYQATGSNLWDLVIHEFGHNWFPMIVGSNERKYAWMDEGMNTFINEECTKWFNGGEFYHQTDQHLQATTLFYKGDESSMTTPDAIRLKNFTPAYYNKPTLGLELLRNVILGKERFDYAFSTYVKRWAWKHPTPWDFFRTMENAAGEDLSWFWRGWFLSTDQLDQAVDTVRYVNGDPSKGALITIENKGKMVLPALIAVKENNGRDSTFQLPVAVWQRGSKWTFSYPSTTALQSVVLDPQHLLPDINPSNNSWDVRLSRPIPADVTAQRILDKYLQTIGGKRKLEAIQDLSLTTNGRISTVGILVQKHYKMRKNNELPEEFMRKITLAGRHTLVEQISFTNRQWTKKAGDQEVPVSDTAFLNGYLQLFPELFYETAPYKMTLNGYALVNDTLTYRITITGPHGFSTTNDYAVNSGLKRKSTGERIAFGGTIIYEDYKNVDGILFPFSITGSVRNTKLDVTDIQLKFNGCSH